MVFSLDVFFNSGVTWTLFGAAIGLFLGVFLTTLSEMFTDSRERAARKYFDKLAEEHEDLWFHGFKVTRYFENDAFFRFQKWLGGGICYEMAALMMILLKSNHSAVLYRGDYSVDGKFRTHHSWVEFRIPFVGRYVADFAWANEFVSKKEYFKDMVNGGNVKCSLVPRFKCAYDEFWAMPLPNILYEKMKSQGKSEILMTLVLFGDSSSDDYGFSKYATDTSSVLDEDTIDWIGEFMEPYYYGGESHRIISTGVLRDFAKKNSRKQPRARNIRKAMYVKKLIEKERKKASTKESPQT